MAAMCRFIFVLCAAAIISQVSGTAIIIDAPINISESLLDQIMPFIESSFEKEANVTTSAETEEYVEDEETPTSNSNEVTDIENVHQPGSIPVPISLQGPQHSPSNTFNETQFIEISYSPQHDDECEVDYISVLNSGKNPEYSCTIKEFAFKNGSIGPTPTPDIGKLEMNEVFSVNLDEHVMEMKSLLELFLDCASVKDLKNAALYYKKIVNPMLFTFSLSSAIIHRKDTEGFSVPGLYNMMPDHFFNSQAITQKSEQLSKNMIDRTPRRNPRKPKKHNVMYGAPVKENEPSSAKSTHENTEAGSARKVETFHNENARTFTLRSSKASELINSYKDKIRATTKKIKKTPRPPMYISFAPHIIQASSSIPINITRRHLKAAPQIPNKKWTPDQTGSFDYPEHRISYFREDIAINSHHWHWHLVYMRMVPKDTTPPDRKGELFYYMHNQMLRRYNAERLAAKLPFVEPLIVTEMNSVLKEGYYPHLRDYAKREFSGRTHNLKFQDISRNGAKVQIRLLREWENNLKRAIKNGYMKGPQNKNIPLDSVNGINHIGSAIEASDASPNKNEYGPLGLHNSGHILISFIHDPLGHYKASSGVLHATETALRDPAFWRWHKHIDDICALHKAQLEPYNDEELHTPYILITEVNVRSFREKVERATHKHTYKKNELGTFFKKILLNLPNGMNFHDKESYKLSTYHLDHHRYDISITVVVEGTPKVEGQVRIFMAPKYDQNKKKFTIQEMQNYAIEMDRFPVILVEGQNIIRRSSRESAVTMTPNRQWAKVDQFNPLFNDKAEKNSFCGCGWPDHLLVPKGTPEGIDYVLFVMISDRTEEKVDGGNDVVRTCDDSLTMCGLLGRKFPDKRAMGFPLDRPIPEGADEWFNRDNMHLLDVKIFHENDLPVVK